MTLLARRAVAAVCAVLFTLALNVAVPGQTNLPKVVQDEIDEARKPCKESKLLKGFVVGRDVNGDGVPDYILLYEHFECDDSTTMFCGTGGCTHQVFASMKDGSFTKVFDDNAKQMRIVTVKGRPALALKLHHSSCAKPGKDGACSLTLVWNGKAFE